MKPIEKPDFLPFSSLPIPRKQCYEAVIYLIKLEIEENCPLSSDEIYMELTGDVYGIGASEDQRKIVRSVAMIAGRAVPHTNSYKPDIIIRSLERA